MKTIKVLLLVLVLTGCNRQDSEIVKLQREVEALKLETLKAATKAQVEVIPKPSEEYKRFMSLARRMNTALGASVEREGFDKLYIELLALYQELPEGSGLLENSERIAVIDYVLAIKDAHSLLVYSDQTGDGIFDLRRQIPYIHIGSSYAVPGGMDTKKVSRLLGERWSEHLDELIPRYNLTMHGGDHLDVDEALPKVLAYSRDAFRKLDKK